MPPRPFLSCPYPSAMTRLQIATSCPPIACATFSGGAVVISSIKTRRTQLKVMLRLRRRVQAG